MIIKSSHQTVRTEWELFRILQTIYIKIPKCGYGHLQKCTCGYVHPSDISRLSSNGLLKPIVSFFLFNIVKVSLIQNVVISRD